MNGRSTQTRWFWMSTCTDFSMTSCSKLSCRLLVLALADSLQVGQLTHSLHLNSTTSGMSSSSCRPLSLDRGMADFMQFKCSQWSRRLSGRI